MFKIHKQLFVTAREANTYDDSKFPLGFWNEYLPGNASFEKKKANQIDWAYIGYGGVQGATLVEENGQTYLSGYKNVYVLGTNTPIRTPYKELVTNPPTVWDNDLLEGFQILNSVSRWSTSNKLWRILDPRGIQFEISSERMAEIILNTTIEKGKILERCCWANDKQKKVLVLESEI